MNEEQLKYQIKKSADNYFKTGDVAHLDDMNAWQLFYENKKDVKITPYKNILQGDYTI